MKKECIVHFKILRNGQAKLLRGLIYLDEGREPTAEDFAQCLQSCGHEVRLEDPERMIFKAGKQGEEYLIDVIEEGLMESSRDPHAEDLAKTFMKQDPPVS